MCRVERREGKGRKGGRAGGRARRGEEREGEMAGVRMVWALSGVGEGRREEEKGFVVC